MRTAPDPKLVEKLEKTAGECYQNVLLPINARMLGPLPQPETVTSRPMVLLLGNHSSGKSTFVNHLLGTEVQKSGVAPTDDCFTLVTSGAKDSDQDGASLVGDPDLGFAALRNFGNTLVSHVNLKVRSKVKIGNIIVVDSPGMIDCPATQTSAGSSTVTGQTRASVGQTYERGYNFMAVTRWFANQSDLILLFFDPDKPGTTGETLECLTSALQGLDHKVMIIFNKCDQFTKMHDFARAYGSLCWNLSKVIPRKDLPPIFTMCTPVQGLRQGLGEESLRDLHATREEVMDKVRHAMEMRADNMISKLDDSTRVLQMYAWVCTNVRSRVRDVWWRVHLTSAAVLAGAAGVSLALYLGRGEIAARGLLGGRGREAWGWALGLGQLLGGACYALQYPRIDRKRRDLMLESELTELFKQNYRMEIANGDESLLSLWTRAMPRVQLAMRTVGIGAIGRVTRQDNEGLKRIVDVEVPSLRRQFARALGDAPKAT